ncbi:MAG: type I restriction-modification system subunit M [Anaerolineae bacterium]
MVNSHANGGELGFERKLWAAADKLRGHLDAAEYKDVVLGLIFLKYISDAFEEHYEQLRLWTLDPENVYYVKDAKLRYQVLEDRDEYIAENIFWVPEKARWKYLQAHARDPSIGILIDEAMQAIERENPRLKGVLPQGYGRDDLDKRRLGELVDLIGTIGLGDSASRSKDILGRVYEYFLGQFADAEGKKGGEFYTPKSIVQLLVMMLEPYQGRVFDPCCGSGGMFVQSERFVKAHGGLIGDIAIYGQESNPTTWRLCKMNLAIRGIEGDLGGEPADSFHNDRHLDLKVDYVLANPPFNMSDWGGHLLQDDVRWKYGTPPENNANFAWVQHFIHHLAYGGQAGFVLANGSMSTQTSGEGEIRRALVEHDLVACMVALPPQLFYNTQIPACLWFLDRGKPQHRAGETLFIDARDAGEMVSRTRRVLTDEEIARIAGVYHVWRDPEGAYEDEPGFCASADLAEIKGHGFVLTPGRYVGFEEDEGDGEPFEEKMERLTGLLQSQFLRSKELEQSITENLEGLLHAL